MLVSAFFFALAPTTSIRPIDIGFILEGMSQEQKGSLLQAKTIIYSLGKMECRLAFFDSRPPIGAVEFPAIPMGVKYEEFASQLNEKVGDLLAFHILDRSVGGKDVCQGWESAFHWWHS